MQPAELVEQGVPRPALWITFADARDAALQALVSNRELGLIGGSGRHNRLPVYGSLRPRDTVAPCPSGTLFGYSIGYFCSR